MYEYGEIILVRSNDEGMWRDRIYVGPGKDGGVIVVAGTDEAGFRKGGSFTASLWEQHKKKPKTVTIGDREVPAPSSSGTECVDLGGFSFCFDSEGDMQVFIAALEDLRC